jgi:O-antigen/teichoic acid export membrane protein
LAARQQLLANGTVLLAVLAPAAVGLALTAHGIAAILVGPRYVDAATILTPWLAAGAFFGGIRAHFLDHAFQLGHRPDLQVHVTAVAAAGAIGLGWLLIPRYGPVGCGAAMTAAMAGSCLHARIAGTRGYPLPLPLAAGVRIGLACAVMALVVTAIPDGAAPAVLLRVIAGGVSYSVSVIALNVLDLRDKVADRVRIGAHRLGRPIR